MKNDVIGALQTIIAGVGTAFVIYIAATLTKYLRKHNREHDFLMRQVRLDTELIKSNTESIKRLVDSVDRRERRAEERARRRRASEH